jgi:hypothetical protein
MGQCPPAYGAYDRHPPAQNVGVPHNRVSLLGGGPDGVVGIDDQRGEQVVAAWEIAMDG